MPRRATERDEWLAPRGGRRPVSARRVREATTIVMIVVLALAALLLGVGLAKAIPWAARAGAAAIDLPHLFGMPHGDRSAPAS